MRSISINKVLFIGLILLATLRVNAQLEWNASVKKTGENTFELHLIASVASGWHIYSQTTPSGGPLPTVVTLNTNPLITKRSDLKEVGEMHKKNEPLFGVEVKYYNDQLEFVQPFTRKTKVKTFLSGKVEYMVCNDKECKPPKNFSFNVSIEK